MERRFTLGPLSGVRMDKNSTGAPVIVGYASVFFRSDDLGGTQYKLFEDYWERVMPGAFDRAMKEDDVRALFNHDPNLLLGRTTSGTCRLSIDKRGLKYEADMPDTTYARDLLAVMARGDVTGSSFSFEVQGQNKREEMGDDGKKRYIRELTQVRLYDVSPVTFPAYTGTSASPLLPSEQQNSLTVGAMEARAAILESFKPAPVEDKKLDAGALRRKVEIADRLGR